MELYVEYLFAGLILSLISTRLAHGVDKFDISSVYDIVYKDMQHITNILHFTVGRFILREHEPPVLFLTLAVHPGGTWTVFFFRKFDISSMFDMIILGIVADASYDEGRLKLGMGLSRHFFFWPKFLKFFR